jgi:hypothetical protein
MYEMIKVRRKATVPARRGNFCRLMLNKDDNDDSIQLQGPRPGGELSLS